MDFTRLRLPNEVVEEVEELLKQGFTYSQIRNKTHVSKASISKIKNGTYKKAPPINNIIDEKEKEYEKLKEENKKLIQEVKKLQKTLNELNFRRIFPIMTMTFTCDENIFNNLFYLINNHTPWNKTTIVSYEKNITLNNRSINLLYPFAKLPSKMSYDGNDKFIVEINFLNADRILIYSFLQLFIDATQYKENIKTNRCKAVFTYIDQDERINGIEVDIFSSINRIKNTIKFKTDVCRKALQVLGLNYYPINHKDKIKDKIIEIIIRNKLKFHSTEYKNAGFILDGIPNENIIWDILNHETYYI